MQQIEDVSFDLFFQFVGQLIAVVAEDLDAVIGPRIM